MIVCNRCGEEKWEEDFYRASHYGAPWRLRPECKACTNGKSAANRSKRYKDNPEKARNDHLRATYGIDQPAYLSLLAAQGGACAICGTDKPGGMGSFHVDHDHSCCPGENSCGKCIRGLLCKSCNWGIGHLKDNKGVIESAALYVAGRKYESGIGAALL